MNMKNKHWLRDNLIKVKKLLLIVSLLILASCSKEEIEIPDEPVYHTPEDLKNTRWEHFDNTAQLRVNVHFTDSDTAYTNVADRGTIRNDTVTWILSQSSLTLFVTSGPRKGEKWRGNFYNNSLSLNGLKYIRK